METKGNFCESFETLLFQISKDETDKKYELINSETDTFIQKYCANIITPKDLALFYKDGLRYKTTREIRCHTYILDNIPKYWANETIDFASQKIRKYFHTKFENVGMDIIVHSNYADQEGRKAILVKVSFTEEYVKELESKNLIQSIPQE